jgi:enoyl-CoA hydratase/carnithine racemase
VSNEIAPSIRLEFREHVPFLTFECGNTINLSFGREFLAAAIAIESVPDVRAIPMTGEGKNFCRIRRP